jgi:hypothetical protein
MIYQYIVSYPDMMTIFMNRTKTIREHWERSRPRYLLRSVVESGSGNQPLLTLPPYAPLSTPSILLLNRQITIEALQHFWKQTWELTQPIPSLGSETTPDVANFIGRETLQNLRHASIIICFMGYFPFTHQFKTVEMLLDTWIEKNQLQSLCVTITKARYLDEIGWEPDGYGSNVLAKVHPQPRSVILFY